MNEINPAKCRWMLYLKNGKIAVENHNQGKKWRAIYRNEYGNMARLGFQLVNKGIKIFVQDSPYGEYWTFEDLEIVAGARTPSHKARAICSLKDKNLGLWDVVKVFPDGGYSRTVMTSSEIGYESRIYIKTDKVFL